MASLSTIYPGFLDSVYNEKLLNRVAWLRREWSRQEELITTKAVDAALKIASRFDSKLVQPTFV